MNQKQFEKSDIPSVVSLLNVCFPQKKITKSSFLWKHFDPLFANRTLARVGIERSCAVAFVCFTPARCYANKLHSIECFSCAVQATHPEYRRRGYVSQLTKAIESNSKIENYFGFSNASGVLIDKNSRSIGYQVIGKLQTAYWLSKLQNNSTTTIEVANIPKEYLNNKKHYFSSFVKSKPYYNWRYVRHPKNKYHFIEIRFQNELVGYAVTHISRNVYVVSEIVTDEKPESYRLIFEALRYEALAKKKLIISFTYMPNHFWKLALPSRSLAVKNIEIYFTLKSKSLSNQPNDWLISGGDIL